MQNMLMNDSLEGFPKMKMSNNAQGDQTKFMMWYKQLKVHEYMQREQPRSDGGFVPEWTPIAKVYPNWLLYPESEFVKKEIAKAALAA